jgi:hypothetical protein
MQKRKTKRKNYTKSNKRLNLDHLFPDNGTRKRGLLTVYIRIKLQVDLQADKSPVVVKGHWRTSCGSRTGGWSLLGVMSD